MFDSVWGRAGGLPRREDTLILSLRMSRSLAVLNRWPTKWQTSSPPASTNSFALCKYTWMGRRKRKGLPIYHAAGCQTATGFYSVEVVTRICWRDNIPRAQWSIHSLITGLREVCSRADSKHKESAWVWVIRPSHLLERQHSNAERTQTDNVLRSAVWTEASYSSLWVYFFFCQIKIIITYPAGIL